MGRTGSATTATRCSSSTARAVRGPTDRDRQRRQPIHEVGLDRVVRPRQRLRPRRRLGRARALRADRRAHDERRRRHRRAARTDWCNERARRGRSAPRTSRPHEGAADQRRQPGRVADNPNGALVRLTSPLGEPGSASALANGQNELSLPAGLPECTADLRARSVRCSGLRAERPLPDEQPQRAARHGRRQGGAYRFASRPRPPGGDRLALRGAGGRVLTAFTWRSCASTIIGASRPSSPRGHCQPAITGASRSATRR